MYCFKGLFENILPARGDVGWGKWLRIYTDGSAHLDCPAHLLFECLKDLWIEGLTLFGIVRHLRLFDRILKPSDY